jgi:hypothetical protein
VPSGAQRALELEGIAQEVRAAGSELVVVNDTVAAARHAAQAGWIRWEEVPRVREHQREDEGTSPIQ